MFGLGSTADPWPIPKLVRLNFVTLNLAKLPKSLPILGSLFLIFQKLLKSTLSMLFS